MKIKKLVSSELKMYIINPKEFTQMIKKKRVYLKEVRKKEKDNQRGHLTRENQWNYLNFAIVLVTRYTNVLNNPVKDGYCFEWKDMYKRPIKFKGTNKLESEIISG